jgi:stearoyl-CoA desaturase (delta-9 desaturase)
VFDRQIFLNSALLSGKNRTYAGILLLHLCPIVAIIIGSESSDWLVFAGMWPVLAVASTLGLHRYFSHKAFKTSRAFQAFMGLGAALSFGDPIGFAGKHRLHHKFSDQEKDVHSPNQGLWQCWIGNLVDYGYSDAEARSYAKDLCRFPELVWLHEHKRIPGMVLALVFFFFGGFTMMAIGYALVVVSIIHLAGAVNYFCHRVGSRRYETKDHSTNNWFVAIFSLGEGWHNNHHRYQASARAGFYWWEIDVLYWLVCVLEWMGLVWDVRRPPYSVYRVESNTEGLELGIR